jgi:hypothetical protein
MCDAQILLDYFVKRFGNGHSWNRGAPAAEKRSWEKVYALQGRCPVAPAKLPAAMPALRTPDGNDWRDASAVR